MEKITLTWKNISKNNFYDEKQRQEMAKNDSSTDLDI